MDTETIQILGKASSIATLTGQDNEAVEIMEAVNIAVPDDDTVEIMRANAILMAGKVAEAEKILRDSILVKSPENIDAKVLLGLALHASGRATDRDAVLKDVLDAEAGDQSTRMLAESLYNA